MNFSFNQKKVVSVPSDKNKKALKLIIAIFAIIFAVTLISTCIYTVNDQEVGVVTTFGKVTSITEAGVHVKLPFGVQQVQKTKVNAIYKIELGYKTDNNTGETTTVESESKMITGDFNIVNVDFFIEYRIADPVKYLFASKSPDQILKMLAQSQIRSVISSYKIDDILTTGKSEIQGLVKDMLIEELALYDIGLSISDVRIQDSEPPTVAVNNAFKAVETAKQGMDTALNNATAYENEKIPLANTEKDKLIQNANYQMQARINEARQQIAMFEAMYSEYELNPEITKIRMYFEAIEVIFPNAKIYIDTSEGGVEKLLPLDQFYTQLG